MSNYIRYHAARALGEIGDSRAVEPLINILKDPDSFIRSYAAGALIEIGDPRTSDVLGALALNDKEEYEVREIAFDTLGRIGDSKSMNC